MDINEYIRELEAKLAAARLIAADMQSSANEKQSSNLVTPKQHIAMRENEPPSSVDECIEHPRFQTERDVVARWLFALSWLAKKHGGDFKRVLNIRGKRRLYFAESRNEIENSGKKVMPQQIPNTNFWVATNNDTDKKRQMLTDAMHVLGYSAQDSQRLTNALVRVIVPLAD